MDAYNDIFVENRGRITFITLNRPQVRNAVSPAMHHELQRAFDAFAADDGQFICVVRGMGDKAFCAGSDLKLADDLFEYPRNGYAGLIERFDLFKPVIAAVNGLALGGGFEIALACDIIVAADNASFGLVEPLVGAMALGGGVHRLVRQIGEKQAMGYLLTSRRMSAEEGLRLGLVNEVVPAADLDAAVMRWCDDILRGAPPALRATKECAVRGLAEASLADAMKHQADYPSFRAWQGSDDLQEGLAAFTQKRAPVWSGK